MTKLTRKGLIELAEDLGAYKCGNVYTIGNDLNYIYRAIKIGEIDADMTKELVDVCKQAHECGAIYVSAKQIAYSVGMYGCSGQIYKVDFLGEHIEKTLFLYC